MPILSGRMVTEAPDLPEDTYAGIQPVWHEDAGTISATWLDPDGTEWPLSLLGEQPGWFTMNGPAGWGATPIELVTDPLPRGGEQVRFIRSKPRRIQWPMYIGGSNHLQHVDRKRRLTRAFTKTTQRGKPGWLIIARPDGRKRLIAAYYEQGLEGEAGEDHTWAKPVITLFCPDGYWSADREVRAYREIVPGGTTNPTDPGEPEVPTEPGTPGARKPFLNPFMTISSSKIVSGGGGGDGGGSGDDGGAGSGGDGGGSGTGGDSDLTLINNPGDVEAWPVWTVRGPMTRLVAENVTLGTRFALTYTLLAEQTITITTNRPTVRGPGNSNLTGKIDWFNPVGTELWPLIDGNNQIRFRVDGAGSGTRVDLVFTPRFETA